MHTFFLIIFCPFHYRLTNLRQLIRFLWVATSFPSQPLHPQGNSNSACVVSVLTFALLKQHNEVTVTSFPFNYRQWKIKGKTWRMSGEQVGTAPPLGGHEGSMTLCPAWQWCESHSVASRVIRFQDRGTLFSVRDFWTDELEMKDGGHENEEISLQE